MGLKRGLGEICAVKGLWLNPGYPSSNVPRILSAFRYDEFNSSETIAFEKMVCHPQFPGGGREQVPWFAGQHGKAPRSVRRQMENGEGTDQSLYYRFSRKKAVRQRKQLSGFRIGESEECWQALAQRAGPRLSSTWPWGDLKEEE